MALLPVAIALTLACQVSADVRPEWNPNGTNTSLASNSLSFRGFNFTNLTNDSIITLNPAMDTWALQLNYSIESLSSTGNGSPQPVYAYALDFAGGELPSQNQSTWTMCAHIFQFPFPENITNLALPPGAVDGDCAPYFGEDCVRDYTDILVQAKRFTLCPSPPTFGQIPSCQARTGQTSQSIVSFSITDWVDPLVVYHQDNNTFTNYTTGQVLNDESVHGLRSGQVFWKQGPSLTSIDNVTQQREEAATLQLIAFTQSPSEAWIANQTGGIAGSNFSVARLVCGRANSTFNGTIANPQSNSNNATNHGVRSAVNMALLGGLVIMSLLLVVSVA